MTVPAAAARVRAFAAARPAAVLAAVAGAVAYVAAVDPEQPGHYPTCPFLALTDLWCPGCGSLRAVHALAHGDVATAVDRNVLTVAAVPMLGVLWVLWACRSVTGRPRAGRGASAAVLLTLAGLVVAFGVLRNVPAGSWLAP